MSISSKSLESKLLVDGNPLFGSKIMKTSDVTIAGVEYLADSNGYILQDSDGVFLQAKT